MSIIVNACPLGELTSAEQEAMDLVVGVYRSFGDGHPEKIEAVQAPDITIWDAFTPYLITKKEQHAFHVEDAALAQSRGKLSMEFTPLHVHVGGQMALVSCQFAFSYAPPRPISAKVRITSVLERRNGQWAMIHHHEAVEPTGWPDAEISEELK